MNADSTLIEPLQRWARAIGGEARLAAVRGVRLHGTVESGGLCGPYELACRSDGRLRQRLALGEVLSQEMTWDGTSATVRDRDGNVRRMSGAELADLITLATLRSHAHLVSGRLRGRVVDDGRDAGGRALVRVEPDGGKPVTVRLDAETGRPHCEEIAAADRTRVLVLDDWTDQDGVGFARRWTESHGDANYDLQVQIESIEVDVELADQLFEPLATEVPATGLEGGCGPAISVDVCGGHVFLPVVLGEREFSFLYDTGAAMTVIDRDLAQRLGLQPEGALEARGAGESSQEAALIGGVDLAIAGASLTGLTLVALPLTALVPHLGHPLDGIIGYDIISRFVTEIDYPGRRLRLHDPSAHAVPAGGDVVPLELENNHPYVSAELELDDGERLTCRFLVDTGADLAVLLTTPFVRRHELLDRVRQRIERQGGGVGGSELHDVGRVASITLGQQRLARPVAVFAQAAKGATASPDFAGIIGGEVLSRFVVHIDYRGHRLVLVPGADLERPFETDMSGLRLTLDEGALVVEHVVTASPAATAGVVAGDRIVAVDGHDIGDIAVAELRRRWRREGVRSELRIERDGQATELAFTTRRMI